MHTQALVRSTDTHHGTRARAEPADTEPTPSPSREDLMMQRRWLQLAAAWNAVAGGSTSRSHDGLEGQS
ncbi:hypothetical protein [Acidovorax sp.]|uniref:hypothetical protein n=1 Tax=Acidovorax sp. TaxID=1872122 RepID=UPI00391F70F9